TSQLQAGMSRNQVAFDIVASDEVHAKLVPAVYRQLLNRAPSAAEVDLWVKTLAGGATQDQFMAAVAGSPEFYQLATPIAAPSGTTPPFASAHFDLHTKTTHSPSRYTGTPLARDSAVRRYGL